MPSNTELEAKIENANKLISELSAAEKHSAPLIEQVILSMRESLQSVNGAPDYEKACALLLEGFVKTQNQILGITGNLRSAADVERGKVHAYKEFLEDTDESQRSFKKIVDKFEGQSSS